MAAHFSTPPLSVVTGSDIGQSIAVDASGNVYLAGETTSTDLPTVNAYQSSLGGTSDAFLFKLNSTGDALLYSSYFGGTSGSETAFDIALDGANNVYITGDTASADLPLKNAYDSILGGTQDAFVAKFDLTQAGSSSLLYSTFFGGSSTGFARSIAVDDSGAFTIAGRTDSTDLPTQNAYQTASGGGTDVYVTRFDSTGSTVTYSTYLGGLNTDYAESLAVDASGNIYVGGLTNGGFPTTTGAFDTGYNGSADGFVSKIDPTQSGSNSLIYSTYLGGSAFDYVIGIDVDTAGTAYLTGFANATFPTTPDGHDRTVTGSNDGFFATLSADGSSLTYSTFLGGDGQDRGLDVVWNAATGSAYVAGSSGGPTGWTGATTTFGTPGDRDAFVIKYTFNQLPTATNNSYTVVEGGTLNGNVITDNTGAGVDSDPDADPLTASLVEGPLHGSLVLNGDGSFTYTPLTEPTSNFADADSFVYQISDGKGGTDTATVSISVTPDAINETPVNSVPGAQTTGQDIPLIFSEGNGNRIVVRDDAGANTIEVILSATNGVVDLASTTGLIVSGGADGSDTVTIQGTLSAINNALDGLSFTPTTSYLGSASLQIATNDLGNAPAAADQFDIDIINIDVIAVNDPPVNTVPTAQTIDQGGILLFSSVTGTAISVSDVDAGGASVQVTLIAANGMLNLSGTKGLTFTPPADGTDDASMTFTGTVADINVALEGATFVAAPGFTGTAGVQITTDDLGNSGAGGHLSDTDTIDITIQISYQSLWLSTAADVASPSGAPGLDSWTSGEVLQFGNPNLAFEPGTTNGTFSSIFNLDTFAGDTGVVIDAIHYVGRDIEVGAVTPMQLYAGDVILSTVGNYTYTSTNSLAVNGEDAFVFRPDTPGDYSSGTFILLIDKSGGLSGKMSGITLIEQDTVVGDVTLNAGDFLYIGDNNKTVERWQPDAMGAATSGTETLFIDGADIDIGQNITAIDVIETDTTIGDVTLTSGQVLLSLMADDSAVGDAPTIGTLEEDIFILDLTTTGSNTAGTATRLFEGLDVGLNSANEDVWAFSLVPNKPPVINDQSLPNLDENSPNGTVVGTVSCTDPEREAAIASLLAADPDLVYSAETGKFYKVSSSSVTWTDANTSASSELLNGVAGELVTIHSQEENDIVQTFAQSVGDVWIGASDVVTEGEFYWYEDGSESTDQFWSGGSSGSATSGAYTNFGSGEPNDSLTDRDYIDLDNSTGQWQVETNSSTQEYVIQWDADEVLGAAQALTYAITAGNIGGAFAIDASTGEITVANSVVLDFETTPTFNLTVAAIDAEGAYDTAAVTIDLNNVNEAPVNTVPGAQTTDEDTSLTFSTANGNLISVANDGGATAHVVVSVGNGTLTVSGAGSATVINDGTSSVTLYGTVADINAALDGLQYTPTADYNGSDTLTLTSQDSKLYTLEIDGSLLGRYEFETPSPGDDSSPTATNDGTLVGDATTVTDGIRGEVLSLDGAGDSVQIAGFYGNPTDVTLAAWVNLTAADTEGSDVISLGDNLGLRLDNPNGGSGVWGYFYDGSGWNNIASGQFVAGTGWHHVAYVFDDANDTHTIFIDGVALNSGTTTATINYGNGTDTIIGAHGNGDALYDFNGLIDDARVYTRALSTQEIAILAAGSLLSDTDTIDITVTPVNDAPTLSTSAPFTDISEDDFTSNGMLVSTYAALANDADDGHLEGIAITSVDDSNGTWQYALDGSNWSDIGSVSTSNALLLAADASSSFRFLPNPDYNGSSGIMSYKAWDQTSGSAGSYVDITASGGTTAFSSGTNGAALTVDPVNDAPELSGAGMYLTTITEDTATNDGDLVSAIVASAGGDPITDVDAGALEGIAIFNLSNSNGTWQYDTGSGWTDVGSVSVNSSLLLRDTDSLRFVPNPDWNGTELFTFAAWDRTSGTAGTKVDTSSFGGTTAFSVGTAIPSITVTAVNDDPTNAGTLQAASVVTEDVSSTINLSAINLSDVDAAAGALTMTLTTSTGGNLTAAAGTGITISGNGTGVLSLTGNLTDLNTYLDTVGNVTYLHGVAHTNGSAADTIQVDITDNGNTGSGGGGTITLGTFNVDITAVNDAPTVATTGTQLAYTEGDGATAIDPGLTLSDVDSANLTGATVRILFGFVSAEDSLGFVDQLGINGSYDSGTGILTLSGTASVADYQTALRSVTYENSSENPNTGDRTINITVTDGTSSSGANRTITVASINDDPTNTGSLPSDVTVTEDVTSSVNLSAVNFSDVDAGTNLITVTLTTSTGGRIWASSDFDVTVFGSGTGTVTLLGGVADLNNFFSTPTRFQYLHGTLHTAGDNADTIQVSVNDGGNTGSGGGTTIILGTVNVDITNVNDAPVITSPAAVSAAENQTGVATVTATDADGDIPTFTITGGADAGLFSITAGGVLTFDTAPDFETVADANSDGVYEVEVTADDGNTGTDAQTILVTVTDVNEAPTLVTLSSSSIDENTDTSGGTTVGSLTTTDPDAGDTATYTINGGADAALFSISGSDLILTAGTLDFETQASYEVTVRITDSGGLTHDQTFTITVNDLNEAPVFDSSAVTSATEDVAYSYAIATSDVDGDALTITAPTLPAWLTVVDNGDGTASLTGTPTNLEVGDHAVVLEVTDGSLTATQSFTITVGNVNDAPVITSPAAVSAAENQTGVATVTATDADGDIPTFTITGGADAGLFSITAGGVLTFDTAPDFETVADANSDGVYEVEVTADDGNTGTDAQTILVTVTDVNEAPTLVTLSSSSIDENTDTSGGTTVGSLTTTDPDAGDTATYTINGGADAALFSISGSDLILTAGTLDFETQASYEVTVRITDSGGLTHDQTFTITVNDLNEAPVFDSSAVTSATEDVAYSYAIATSDVDGDALTITAPTLPAWLTVVDNGDGTASLTGTPTNLEVGDHAVVLEVTDGSLTATQSFTITVGNVNDAPVITSPAAVSAAENQTGVATVTATDADGDIPTFTITGGADAGLFSITAGGVLTFDTAPDFETFADANSDGVYEVEVTADDGNTGTDAQTILVTVTDVNEAPTLVTLSSSSIDENTDTSGGTTVGSLTTTDPDAGDTATYTINGGADAALFSISGSDLILTAGTLDFETQASYEVTVRITDSGGLTHDQTFTITVNDLNEAPVFDSSAVTSATEDVAYSYAIATSDVDGDALTITAPTLPAWLTVVDNGDGTASLTGTPTNLEVGDHAVVLEVTDGSLTATQSFTITVGNVNDAPVITSPAAVSAAENQTGVATVTATDADGDIPTFTITGGADAGLFSITAGGVLTFDTAPDFETVADANSDGVYEVEVTADDGNTGTDAQTILVTVTDVNEAPTLVTLSSSSIDENTDTSGGTTVGSLTTTDPDAGDTATYTINGGADAALFSISGSDLILTAGTLDFETQASYEVTVRITDSGGLTHDQTFTITVNDLNEAPVFDSSAVTSATEDVAYSYAIATSDVDGDALTITAPTLPAWLTVVDNGDGTASLTGTPTNLEVGDHAVVLEVTDGSLTATQSFTITVGNVNDAPVITSPAAVSAAENQTGVATVTATDADGDIPTFTITGGADAGLFSITAGGVLTFDTAPDFETVADANSDGVYEVEVTADDGNTGTDAQTILVTVTDVNEAPTLVTLSSSSIDENTDTSGGTTVGSLTTTDPDAGDTATYTINGGADAALFSISGSDLILTAGTLDFETQASYEVTVRITDSGGLTHDQTFTITVNDLNEAPVFDSSAVTSATEDVAYSYAIATSDVDGDALTITAPTLPAWLTVVDNGDGTASLTGTPTNLEVGDHAVVLEVTDGSLTATQSFTITVGNVNDAPVITSPAAVSAAENQPVSPRSPRPTPTAISRPLRSPVGPMPACSPLPQAAC